MTSSINFVDLGQKMNLLKELHAEMATEGGNDEQLERYIELRREVTGLLMPLFGDLAEMEMIILATFPPDVEVATVDILKVDGVNGGIQLSVKKFED